ncbi:hypothetical protein ACOMHN_024044 [Nucella lapillus]
MRTVDARPDRSEIRKYNVREDREGDSEALKVTQAGRKKSSSHLQTRSDDNRPLQVLIDHLSQQITVMGAEILALRASYHQIENVQASTFIHWGSSTCSDMSQLVYLGVAGGPTTPTPAGAPTTCA